MLQITNSVKLLAGLTFLVAACCMPSQGSAQGVESYLRKADLNDDGKIAPSEMTRPIKQYLVVKGYDVSQDLQIADIVEKATAKKAKAGTTAKGELKVPKFGVDAKAKSGVGAFGAAESVKPVEYSEAITSRTQNTFDRYDVNSNGTLEESEIANVPWSSPSPSVSDKNGDGRLSFQEMQERFRERETAQQRSGRSSSDADRGGGGNGGWRGGRRFNRSGDSSGLSVGRFQRSRDDDDDDDERSTRKSSRSSVARPSGRSTVNDERQKRERAEQYVESYFKSRDSDKNGVIEGDELKKIGSSSKSKYDKDGNGKITRSEVMAVAYPSPTKSKNVATSRSPSKRNNSRSNNSRSYTKNSAAFNKADTNKDRLVQMNEFSKKWTKKKLDEFLKKDANGDGVISPKEW